ncbi:hypothetical protein [Spongiactinospora sp. TRM90649]|uniref:hypothetical protein n=1 Tax=Spongiactinospora sp. TRM90649 TaxID=3031114 RepID=UPI0023F7A2F5|nr:hypothetical protein [Spongiactinospora sp. TRM90649]MDF5756977.1 hypothetical protein [Spongiactinospora sp. TRM90649]
MIALLPPFGRRLMEGRRPWAGATTALRLVLLAGAIIGAAGWLLEDRAPDVDPGWVSEGAGARQAGRAPVVPQGAAESDAPSADGGPS